MICGVRMWNGRLWPERARVILWRSRNTKSSTFFEAKTERAFVATRLACLLRQALSHRA